MCFFSLSLVYWLIDCYGLNKHNLLNINDLNPHLILYKRFGNDGATLRTEKKIQSCVCALYQSGGLYHMFLNLC